MVLVKSLGEVVDITLARGEEGFYYYFYQVDIYFTTNLNKAKVNSAELKV